MRELVRTFKRRVERSGDFPTTRELERVVRKAILEGFQDRADARQYIEDFKDRGNDPVAYTVYGDAITVDDIIWALG